MSKQVVFSYRGTIKEFRRMLGIPRERRVVQVIWVPAYDKEENK